MIDFKGHRSEKDLILICIRWYLAYPLSYRNLADMMEERGVEVDHSTIYRWVRKFTPKLEAIFRKGRKRPVSSSWRMDETHIKSKGDLTAAQPCLSKTNATEPKKPQRADQLRGLNNT
ncbi:Transposase-like protein [Nitrosococcus watsonii C-113]|uniref:Transposase-like protein n=1 Tax=Nitrosococcus watsoni (strain C-113) TaxID=105559 RepID=D8K9B6_NITWC|nr:Transposase-like protein [Nitrosococcus watsonii C-113]